MDKEIDIPFNCEGAGLKFIDLSDGDGVTPEPALITQGDFVLKIFPDEWKQGESVDWAISSCPNTGCDITVYKYPDGRIIAHCSDCDSERGSKIV